jgi:hypothetical protein
MFIWVAKEGPETEEGGTDAKEGGADDKIRNRKHGSNKINKQVK